MKDKETLISIIVPIYNIKKEYLEHCIESLINQTMKDIEIILVDDGSINESKQVCEEYAKKDNRIKVYTKQNEGVSSARNYGMEKAKSPYIMFVDGDDWIDKNCCEEAYSEACRENIDIVAWSYYKQYESGKKEKIEIFDRDKLSNKNEREFNYYDMRILGSSCMKLYTREIIGKERFNTHLINGEDVEFNFRIFKKVNSIKYIKRNYYNYLIRNDSTVRKYNEKMLENYNITLETMRKELDVSNIQQTEAYFSFVAICFLMLCLNYIFSEQNKIKNKEKKEKIKIISNMDFYKEMLKNMKKVRIPITRKIPLILIKYKCFVGVNIIVKIKNYKMKKG